MAKRACSGGAIVETSVKSVGTPPLDASKAAESFLVGTWLSLVEHSLGVRGVGSSNLPVPTIQRHHSGAFLQRRIASDDSPASESAPMQLILHLSFDLCTLITRYNVPPSMVSLPVIESPKM
jgi:hypothetical protein